MNYICAGCCSNNYRTRKTTIVSTVRTRPVAFRRRGKTVGFTRRIHPVMIEHWIDSEGENAVTRKLLRASDIIAFQAGEHRHLVDGVVVLDGNEVLHVGGSFDGQVDEVIDFGSAIITPGFVNTHSHLAGSPLDKSFIEDRGSRQFYLSGLFEYLPVRSAAQDREAGLSCLRYSMAELIRTGTTTVMELGTLGDDAVAIAGAAGLRFYAGQMYRSGAWHSHDGLQVTYSWDEEAGLRGLEEAIAFVERVDGTHNDRIRGFLTPSQIDTCTEDLLRRSRDAATSMGVPLALHVSQSVNEFQEMIRRHGLTPIEWLEQIGFLGPDVILGHAIVVGNTSWANYFADDIGILADTGANVAHCVWVFARRGIAMESFHQYRERGVSMTLGTDTSPQSMLEALRWAAVVSKIVDRRTEVATARDVFDVATLGGAQALGRDDLGRIAPGAKADLLVWNADSLFMTPMRDPVKNIVYSAQAEDLQHVFIDGEQVMADGTVLTVDEAGVSADLQEAAERMWAKMGEVDRLGRSVDQLSPQTFAPFEG